MSINTLILPLWIFSNHIQWPMVELQKNKLPQIWSAFKNNAAAAVVESRTMRRCEWRKKMKQVPGKKPQSLQCKHLIQTGFCSNSVNELSIKFFVVLFQHLHSRSLILKPHLNKELLKGESFLFWSQWFLHLTSLKIDCSFWREELI